MGFIGGGKSRPPSESKRQPSGLRFEASTWKNGLLVQQDQLGTLRHRTQDQLALGLLLLLGRHGLGIAQLRYHLHLHGQVMRQTLQVILAQGFDMCVGRLADKE